MKFFGQTDIGMQRKENQDRIFVPEKEDAIKLFIVADGMGGANAGGTASKMAIEYVRNSIEDGYEEAKDDREKVESLIRKSIIDANKYVYKKSKENPEYAGMGTTISVALIIKNKVYIGHVGDSRVYRIRKEFIRQLTKDHSYVQALVQNGTITKAEAVNHPQKNVLLKVLGCEPELEPDVLVKGFLKEDVLMICSDGLTNMISVPDIFEEIKDGKNDLKKTCNNLISQSKKNGGYDNISVILVFND
ncbi:MAG: Stp1/IreP family PP2C-type Ser/Thr phosphatase [Clostridia bacterium]|nr:Stp1/IreP family PP2C-type Ser/Thr phosphatase [Clostridia bacterium]